MLSLDLLCRVEWMRRRASGKMYQRYRINQEELMMLCCIASQCAAREQCVVGKGDLFDGITGNSRRKVKFEGYLHGLIRGQFVGCYEYVRVAGSLCVGVSAKGEKVLRDYHAEIIRLIEVNSGDKSVCDNMLSSYAVPSYYRAYAA